MGKFIYFFLLKFIGVMFDFKRLEGENNNLKMSITDTK